MIVGPLLLELGMLPQVTAATGAFMVLFSSSLAVAQFALLNMIPLYTGELTASRSFLAFPPPVLTEKISENDCSLHRGLLVHLPSPSSLVLIWSASIIRFGFIKKPQMFGIFRTYIECFHGMSFVGSGRHPVMAGQS
jgi:hypothetical protein